jgi:hypothetical protein
MPLSGIQNQVSTSQETHYVSATEPNQIMLLRFEVFTARTMKNAAFWNKEPSSYFTGDTLRLGYRVQPVNAM